MIPNDIIPLSPMPNGVSMNTISNDAKDGAENFFEWLRTEVSAIPTRYQGDPSYDHDAYWMKGEVLSLVDHAEKAFPALRTPAQQEEAGPGEVLAEHAALYAEWEKGLYLHPAPAPIADETRAGFQPVETAPEDEHVILATTGDFVGEALMLRDEETGEQKWTWALGPVHANHTPLGWQKMPAPISRPVLPDSRPGGFDGPTGAD